MARICLPRTARRLTATAVISMLGVFSARGESSTPQAAPQAKDRIIGDVVPFFAKFCLDCHSTKIKKGELDLEHISTLDQARKELRSLASVIENLENGEMPPKGKRQPSDAERKRLTGTLRSFLNEETVARAGDPGRVVLRRLNNAEFNYTVRDLTGIDLQPAREFPADGAAGEGFANTGEALVMSPSLFSKFLNAGKEIANHAVLLPDGFRFSAAASRRDWTNEAIATLRQTYQQYSAGPDDGRLDFVPYLRASIVYRDGIAAGRLSRNDVASREKLNVKYFNILWQYFNEQNPSDLMSLRSQWQATKPNDVEALAAAIRGWQTLVWKFNKIGSYRSTIWQEPNKPAIAGSQNLQVKPKLAPDQGEVVFHLAAHSLPSSNSNSRVIWRRPRLEGGDQPPIPLSEMATSLAPYEAACHTILGDTARYLAASLAASTRPDADLEKLAERDGLDAKFLARWIEYLELRPAVKEVAWPAVPLHALNKKLAVNPQRPLVQALGAESADTLPAIFANASDKIENIPGTIGAHKIAVHPTPTQFAGVVWKSPIEGAVRVDVHVAHAHPACGNGVAWWVERRHDGKAKKLEGGQVDVGKKADTALPEIRVAKGDLIVLAIGARDGNHFCDLTSVDLTISEPGGKGRWDLAADVNGSLTDANPHADQMGNNDVWQFVRGSDPTLKDKAPDHSRPRVPSGSALAKWREATLDRNENVEASRLAEAVRELLTGDRPADPKHPDRVLYDSVGSLDGPLFRGIDLVQWAQKHDARVAVAGSRFGIVGERGLAVATGTVVEVRLPAALVKDRQFVVEGALAPDAVKSLVQFEVSSNPADAVKRSPTGAAWVGSNDLIGDPKQLQAEFDAFRNCFPTYLYFAKIVPDDEGVCLRLYFREDEHLGRLFLNAEQKRQLDRLWQEHRFISQFPDVEHKNLPLFIGFVTQDQPKEMLVFFEGFREPFRKRAQEFETEVQGAAVQQWNALIDFATRAYRRPLRTEEKEGLRSIYESCLQKGLAHEEAFRAVLTRLFVSPTFLYRLEEPPPGKEARPVSDWELASRLSYFLWSSQPDAELATLAAAHRLHDKDVLSKEVERMLQDPRSRALGLEFGAQWIHVRGFENLKEKNEALFPMFDENLRKAMAEEAVLFFQDFFQRNRPFRELLDADYGFLNETLAKHYGIPGVTGSHWCRVEGVKKYGRGGILGFACVQAQQSGASRTSPVLRGNWVVETLLGEKLPRPPANVPQLPEAEAGNDGLTMRQLVEKHTRLTECAVCHTRIDPLGFALERYDPIGRWRDKDLGGLPIDARAKLRDGAEFEGIDGLRTYLLKNRKDVFVRSFCRKLLGFALGRSVGLSDQPLIDEMIAAMDKNEGRIGAAVHSIVHSPQFRMIRGKDAAGED